MIGNKKQKLQHKTFRKTGIDSYNTKTVSINISSEIQNYQELTSDNFGILSIGINPLSTDKASAATISYTPSTGTVTVSLSVGPPYVSIWNLVTVGCWYLE